MAQELPPIVSTAPPQHLQKIIGEPPIHRWTEKSDMVRGYAKESWRPSQSVIDLIQNHLDAQEAFWEREFLQAIGIDPDKKSASTRFPNCTQRITGCSSPSGDTRFHMVNA